MVCVRGWCISSEIGKLTPAGRERNEICRIEDCYASGFFLDN